MLQACQRGGAVRSRLAPDQKSYEPMETKQLGCGPVCCSQLCDKALGAICLEGAVFRIAVAQFVGKTSDGPLLLLLDGFYKIMKTMYLEIVGDGFVDDWFFVLPTPCHGECAGLEGGGCPLCSTGKGRRGACGSGGRASGRTTLGTV